MVLGYDRQDPLDIPTHPPGETPVTATPPDNATLRRRHRLQAVGADGALALTVALVAVFCAWPIVAMLARPN